MRYERLQTCELGVVGGTRPGRNSNITEVIPSKGQENFPRHGPRALFHPVNRGTCSLVSF